MHIFVFVFLEVEEGDEAGVVDGGEDEGGERTPADVDDAAAEREVHDGVGLVDVPDLDGEVGGAGDEGVRVVVVPVHVVDRQFVAALGLQLRARLGLGALVDGALLRADQELAVVVLGAEVEAQRGGLLRDGRLLVLGGLVARDVLAVELEHVDGGVFVALGVLLEFEHHDDLALEFALDQPPGAEFAVRGHGLEVLGVAVRVPPDLPHGVVVLAALHARAVLRLRELVADVLDED